MIAKMHQNIILLLQLHDYCFWSREYLLLFGRHANKGLVIDCVLVVPKEKRFAATVSYR